MITLKQLSWDNCFSYGPNNNLRLDTDTVTQIIGTNGMGKSSIPLIIEEALYNKNSKGIKKADIPNRYMNNGYTIWLLFEKDGNEYLIDVKRSGSIKVKLEKNGEDISSHTATNTYKTIQEIIGIDFKTFSQLVYQSTNASLQFLTATDTNRKKFLIDLLHLDDYVQLFEVFKEAARTASNKMIEVTSEIATVEKWLNTNKLDSTNILPMLDLEINTDEEEKEFRSLSIELENISEKNKKILRNNQYKEMLAAINLDEINNIQVAEKISPDDFQKELGQLEAGMKASERMLQKLEKLDDVCPTCEQKVDSDFKESLINEEKKTISFMTEKINENKEKVTEIRRNNTEFDRKNKLQKDWEDLFRSIDNELPTTILDKEQLESRLGFKENYGQQKQKFLELRERTRKEQEKILG